MRFLEESFLPFPPMVVQRSTLNANWRSRRTSNELYRPSGDTRMNLKFTSSCQERRARTGPDLAAGPAEPIRCLTLQSLYEG